MFSGCTSLESIDFTNLKIPFNVGNSIDDNTFAGCTYLRELKISDCTSYNNKSYNIFADTEELAYVEINSNWKHVNSYPERGTWTKVGDIANRPAGAVNVGTKLSNTQLFQNFQKIYAGKWQAESSITLRGNGGNPKFQTVPGTRGGVADFDPDGGTMYDDGTVKVASGKTIPALPGANRIAFAFDGWYTEKNGGGEKLTTDTPITENKTYYAHWTPIDQSSGIYQYSIGWRTDSNSNVTNNGDNLVLHPLLGDEVSAMLYIRLKINNALAPNKHLPAGSVRITVPKSFFKENGVALDTNNINEFSSETYEYSEVGDNFVFTNKSELDSSDNSIKQAEITLYCTSMVHVVLLKQTVFTKPIMRLSD